MVKKPFRIRLRRVRDEVWVDYLVQLGRSGWTAVEHVNMGSVTLKEAAAKLKTDDLSSAPRMKAALSPIVTE